MSENNNDLGAFLAGFVIGGLVGAATALILAPQSGSETRTLIGDRSSELRTVGGDRARQYRETAGTYTQDYRDRAGQAMGGARNRVQEAGGQVQDRARIVLDSGKERASQVKNQVNTLIQRDNSDNGSSEVGASEEE